MMSSIAFPLAALFALSAVAALAVLVPGLARMVSAWRELSKALEACPASRTARITNVDLVVRIRPRPARPRPVSLAARPFPAQPDLRAAA